MPQLECRFCQAHFTATRGSCCKACRPKDAAERAARWRRKFPDRAKESLVRCRPPKGPVILECPDCYADFVRRGRQLRCDSCRKALGAAMCRRYKRSHREAMRDYDRQWAKNNPDKKLAIQQRSRYSQNWLKTLARDGYKCTVCSVAEDLIVHHKNGRGRTHDAPDHSLENLQTMCRSCHMNHHRRELRHAS